MIEEYFANGALERRWVAVREGADALREKATELAQPLTELISPAKPKSKDDELDAAAALIQRRGAAQLESATPQRMLMLSEPRILATRGEVGGDRVDRRRERG